MNLQNKRPYFRHLVIELESPFNEANSLEWIKEKIGLFIQGLDIKTITSVEHLFKPQGISLIYIISSSHLSVHTWPENNYIHLDLLTCSRNFELNKMDEVIRKVFPEMKYLVSDLVY